MNRLIADASNRLIGVDRTGFAMILRFIPGHGGEGYVGGAMHMMMSNGGAVLQKFEPVLDLDKTFRTLPGMAFGLRQPVIVGLIRIALPAKIDFNALDRAMSEFVPDLAIREDALGRDTGASLLKRMHEWHAAIQRSVNVPVFGPCHVAPIEDGSDKAGNQLRMIALPLANSAATMMALRWTIEAINLFLAGPADGNASREVLREKYAELTRKLQDYAVPGTNTFHFMEAAYDRRIELNWIADAIFRYGCGRNSVWLDSSITSNTPWFGVRLARNKAKSAHILRYFGLPTPDHIPVANEDEAVAAAARLGYPVVIKPADKEQGLGVFASLATEKVVRTSFQEAAKHSGLILVEKHIPGEDYRITVMQGEVIKIMYRRPGGITGDGRRTVATLIADEQLHPHYQRTLKRTNVMRLTLDDEARELIAEAGLDTESVPPAGKFIPLRRKSNISAGGTHGVVPAADIHPDNLSLAIHAAQVLGLDIAGIDLITPDITRSWREVKGAICEVNAQPQISHRDTPELFGNMLAALLKDGSHIPLHLFLLGPDVKPPKAPVELAKRMGCNAVSLGKSGWIEGAGIIGPLRDGYASAKAILGDRRVTAALVIMTAEAVVKFGLPAASFTSIRFHRMDASGDTGADTLLSSAGTMVQGHSNDIKTVLHKPGTPQPQT